MGLMSIGSMAAIREIGQVNDENIIVDFHFSSTIHDILSIYK